MRATIQGAPVPAHHEPVAFFWSSFMKWETPQATEFRFGMEITMYVANR
jgi:coenzyme PQQ precursor peptide PqqA